MRRPGESMDDICMYSLVNNEINGSKRNEIIEVQNKNYGHSCNHK